MAAAAEELLFERLCKVDPTLQDALLKHRRQLDFGDYDSYKHVLETEENIVYLKSQWRKAIFCVFDAKLLELKVNFKQHHIRVKQVYVELVKLFPFIYAYGEMVESVLLAANGNEGPARPLGKSIWESKRTDLECRLTIDSLTQHWDFIDTFLSETDMLLEALENTSRCNWSTFIKCMIIADRYDASDAIVEYLNSDRKQIMKSFRSIPSQRASNVMRRIESLIDDKTKYSKELEKFLYDLIKKTSILPGSMVVEDVEAKESCSTQLSKGEQKSTGESLALRRMDVHVDFKILYRKARVWQQLRHENVLPFIGFAYIETLRCKVLVTPWMANGSLNAFIKSCGDFDRVHIISQIASGLHYLHSQQPAFIHGDLHTGNILIDGRRRPVIAVPLSNGVDSNTIWQAPETHSAGGRLSEASDIYAFAVTCLEVFTGKDLTGPLERPKSPEVITRGLDDAFWGLLCKCWSDRPESRPTISDICDFPPIAKKAIKMVLSRVEEDFAFQTASDSASEKMREFIRTTQSWLTDPNLLSSLDFPDFERMFTIILEKFPMDDFIKTIHDEYSASARASLINLLHEMLQFKNKLKDRRRLDRLLTRIVKETGQIPLSIIIEEVTRNGPNPVAGGGFADVWAGMRGNMNVALKVLRIFGEGDYSKQILRAFCAEVLLWHRLHHSNVMPFLGVCVREFAPRYALVSPWMKNGHLLEYLRKHPLSDRRALMLGIAKGMEYLHSLKPAVIHGDLRSLNILIDDDGQPRISDFGLARLFVSEGSALTQTSFKGQGSVFWQAPELLFPSRFSDIESGPTKNTDVYAFACVCIEIFTEKVPFSGLTDAQVIVEVGFHDGRPPRPSQPAEERGLSDAVWSLIQDCWAIQPAERSSMTIVCARIQDIIANQGSVNL